MKSRSCAVIVLLLALLQAPLLANQPSLPLSICYTPQALPPLLFGDGENPKGLVIDALHQAAQASHINISFIAAPWKRCLRELAASRVHATLLALYSPERAQLFVYPRNHHSQVNDELALWRSHYYVYHLSDNPLRWDGQNFQHLQHGVAAPAGYVAYDKLKQLNALPSHIPDPQQGLQLVLKTRLDGYVLDELSAQILLQQYPELSHLSKLEPVFLTADHYLPVSQGYYAQHQQQIEQFWRVLAQQRQHTERLLQQAQFHHQD